MSLQLSGILNLVTDGTIITTDITNSAKPLLGLAGNAAGAAIQDAYNKGKKEKNGKTDSGKFGAALGALGGKIVTSGLNLIFGSFLGIFDKTTETRSTVELKTEGKATFTGSAQKNESSAIPPIQNLLIPGTPATESDHVLPLYDKALGAWNVRNLPTIELDNMLTPTVYPVTPARDKKYKEYCVDYLRSLRKLPFGKDDIVINPETRACISDYDVKVDYYVISKFDGKYCLADTGNYNQYISKCVYEEQYTEKKDLDSIKKNDKTLYTWDYKTAKTMFYELDDYRAEFENSSFDLPQYTFPATMSDDAILNSLKQSVKYKTPKTMIYSNYMAKVSVIFYPKAPYNDKPILSTKTFRPIIRLRTINPSPIFVYNPYMKPEYVSSYDLWMNRWNWAK